MKADSMIPSEIPTNGQGAANLDDVYRRFAEVRDPQYLWSGCCPACR